MHFFFNSILFNFRPDIDDTKDPSESLMGLLKQMYDDGDDEMKRTLSKAWYESREKKGSEMVWYESIFNLLSFKHVWRIIGSSIAAESYCTITLWTNWIFCSASLYFCGNKILNPCPAEPIPCFCKQWRARSVGQLILICTVYVNLYQHFGSSDLIGWHLEMGVAS